MRPEREQPKFEFDPDDGPHAASGLTNEEVEYLHRIISLEMAVRMNKEQFIEHFRQVGAARKDQDEMVNAIRKDRDRMHFVASVRADLEKLPMTSDDGGEEGQSYGMYL